MERSSAFNTCEWYDFDRTFFPWFYWIISKNLMGKICGKRNHNRMAFNLMFEVCNKINIEGFFFTKTITLKCFIHWCFPIPSILLWQHELFVTRWTYSSIFNNSNISTTNTIIRWAKHGSFVFKQAMLVSTNNCIHEKISNKANNGWLKWALAISTRSSN